MISHRHTRGTVLDLNSEVCVHSYLENTKIGEAADVYMSTLVDSWADNSKILHSDVVAGDIRHSEVVLSAVAGSDIINSRVYDGAVLNSKLENVTLRGGTVNNCDIDADCVIGQAVLDGLTIREPMRIGVGYWSRVPRSFEINNEIVSGVVVTESTNGCAYIGCQRKPMLTWIKGSRRFGKVIGWDTQTVDYIVSKFEEWLKDSYG